MGPLLVKPDVLVPPAAAREPLRLAPGAQPRALGAARARRRREVLDPDRRQFAAPSRLRRFAAPIQLGAKIEPDRSWSNNAALTVGSSARDRNRHSRFPDAGAAARPQDAALPPPTKVGAGRDGEQVPRERSCRLFPARTAHTRPARSSSTTTEPALGRRYDFRRQPGE